MGAEPPRLLHGPHNNEGGAAILWREREEEKEAALRQSSCILRLCRCSQLLMTSATNQAKSNEAQHSYTGARHCTSHSSAFLVARSLDGVRAYFLLYM